MKLIILHQDLRLRRLTLRGRNQGIRSTSLVKSRSTNLPRQNLKISSQNIANRVKRNQNLRKYNLTTFSQKSETMSRDDQIREKNDKCTKKWISPFINFKMVQNYKGRNHDFIRQQLSESFENIKSRYLQEQGRIKAAELKSHMTDMPRREHPKIIPIK